MAEQQLDDVWILETPDEEAASEDLNTIASNAMKFSGVSERAYLRKLWNGESWQSIKAKLETDSSDWYVWWLDGVRQHIANYQKR